MTDIYENLPADAQAVADVVAATLIAARTPDAELAPALARWSAFFAHVRGAAEPELSREMVEDLVHATAAAVVERIALLKSIATPIHGNA